MSEKIPNTLILAVLDESGSMQEKQSDVIGGFNRFLDDQKKLPDSCRLGIVKFNTEVNKFLAPKAVADVQTLTPTTYSPGGSTALLDAIAESVKIAETERQGEERILVLVVTDGEENSSRETTLQQIKDLIKAKEALGFWTFTYLGVDPAKWHDKLGIAQASTQAYQHHAPAASFQNMSHATAAFRGSTSMTSDSFYSPKTTTHKDWKIPVDDELTAKGSGWKQ